MEGLYLLDNLVNEQLLKLGEHFAQVIIISIMHASQWFITVFSYSFPFHLVIRVWDVFLYEGVKIVFKAGLALLKCCQDDLVKVWRGAIRDADIFKGWQLLGELGLFLVLSHMLKSIESCLSRF